MNDKQTFGEAIGMTDAQINELSEKCSVISFRVTFGDLEFYSEIAEVLKKEFSYNELLMLSMEYIVLMTERIIDKNENL
jgi:hypothetical protein